MTPRAAAVLLVVPFPWVLSFGTLLCQTLMHDPSMNPLSHEFLENLLLDSLCRALCCVVHEASGRSLLLGDAQQASVS